MPPEASTDHYGPPLDMFSFGHLCLFTATQVFPGDLLPSTYTDPRKNKVKARTELERRESYMSPLEATLGKTHGLVSLVKRCLENDPRRRPTTSQALDRMRDMMARLRPPFLHMNRFQLEKTLTDKSAEAEAQAREIADNRRRLQHLNQGIEELRSKKAELEKEVEVTARKKAELQAVTELKAVEMKDLKKNFEQLKLEKSGMEEACQGMDEVVKIKEENSKATRQLLEAKSQQLLQLESALGDKYRELASVRERCTSLLTQNQKLMVTEQEQKRQLSEQKSALAEKTQHLEEKDHQLSSLQGKCSSLETQVYASQTQLLVTQSENQTLKTQERVNADILSLKEAEIAAITKEMKGKNKLLQSNMKVAELLPGVLKCNLPLKWKTTTEMLMGPMIAQAVVIGEKVYIGGGNMSVKKVRGSGEGMVGGSTDREEKVRAHCSILEYSMTGEGPQWRTIVAPTVFFAMAAVDNQLIVAGGADPDTKSVSDQVSILGSDDNTIIWAQPFPAMPTARYAPSAIGYKRWLAVVRGSVTPDHENPLDVVEELDTSSKQWYKASPLPSPTIRPSLAI
ncbi:hypothetical protein GBAR_LOCUS18765, partial [Geodia barretti]